MTGLQTGTPGGSPMKPPGPPAGSTASLPNIPGGMHLPTGK